MIDNDNHNSLRKFNMVNEVNSFNINYEFQRLASLSSLVSSLHQDFKSPNKLIDLMRHSPNCILILFQNKKVKVEDLDEEIINKLFSLCCNMLKEIERESKLLGLKIMDFILDHLTQESFMNAFVFERELVKSFNVVSSKSKLVSLGDYEMTRTEGGNNFGFFAASLEEEKKDIKILTLRTISKIGQNENNKDFALLSFKYVIELVNDEEDDVRFETIKCLELLIKNFKTIDIDSCEILFFNMKEKSQNLRQLLYSLLSYVYYSKSEDYHKSIKKIFDNIKLYPEDKLDIFELVKQSAKNNCEFIEKETLVKLLDLDPNILIQEYNWNDLEYCCKLLILQEFIKSRNFNFLFSVPKFFIKHFNYLSDKYDNVFEKQIYKFLLDKYLEPCEIENKSKNCEASDNNSLPSKAFDSFNEMFLFFTNTNNYNNPINIYSSVFSFLNFINTTENLDFCKSLIIIHNIINIFGKLNFQLSIMPSFNPSIHYSWLTNLNDFICSLIMTSICDKFGFSSTIALLIIQKENRKRLESNITIDDLINKLEKSLKTDTKLIVNNGKDTENILNKLLEYLKIDFSEFIFSPIVTIKFTNPKNNFNYVHTKEKAGLKFPFYLSVSIKIKLKQLKQNSISEINKIEVAKALNIIIIKQNWSKVVGLDPSNIKLNDHEGGISIKLKLPLYIQENESNDYQINIVKKSSLKCEYKHLLQKFHLSPNFQITDFTYLTDNINFILN